jgi:DNA-binding transcriptional ArsR family regulator
MYHVPGGSVTDSIREEVVRLHAQVCNGLADPNRILIIYALSESPLSVNDLANKMELSQPTVSRHLKILRERGIVKTEREGQSIIYSLSDQRFIQALDLLRATLADQLKGQALLARQANEHLIG